MQRMSSSLGEVWPKSISPDIFQLVFVWQWWNGTCWVLSREGLIEKHKVCEATPDSEVGFLKGFEVGLIYPSHFMSQAQVEGSRSIEERTWVVTRYETYASLVPSFSF